MAELDPDQAEAVKLMLDAPVSVVTGGPGVGKTTTIHAATSALDKDGISYALCAPTGKAARRMTEATGKPASTIHRLLEWSPDGFRRYAQNKLSEALIICDESSMLDIRLAADLLEAVAGRIVFVGDANQLPPVGPGAFFRDLITSEAVPVVTLKTLHRAAQESWICRNAPKVLAGDPLELEDIDDFGWYEMDTADVEHIPDVVLDIVREEMREGLSLEDAQVLAPMKTRKGGVVPLNVMLQSHLNPSQALGYKIFDETIRPGDRVMQTRNNYDLGIFNGEVGVVMDTTQRHITVRFDDRAIEFKHGDARDLRLAYAMTIHKSQGSEWPVVIVVCHSEHGFMLTRQLLYTALTRSKDRVYIVGDRRGLQTALRTVKDAQRKTLLQQRLTGAL
jgi:exodeoxyribonuclease V alpha subunit